MVSVGQIVAWLAVFALAVLVFNKPNEKPAVLDYSDFKQKIASAEVADLTVTPALINGQYKNEEGVMKPFKTVSKANLQNIISKKGFQARVNEMVSINTKAKTTINDNLIIAKANGVYGMKVPFLQEPPIPIEEPDFYFEGNHFTEITKNAEDCIAVHDFSKEEISEFIAKNDIPRKLMRSSRTFNIPNGKIADVINLMYEERVNNSV